MKIIGWIFMILLTLIMAVFLELNKNTLFGWLLLLIAAVLFVFLYGKFLSYWWLKGIGWLAYTGIFALIVMISWPPVKSVAAVSVKNPEHTEAVHTRYGDVRGVYNEDHSVEVYAGIPYAAPPTGDLRWKEPQDAQSWQGIRECDTFAPMAMQTTNLPVIDSLTQIIGYHDYKISFTDNSQQPVSEDCLYLNIWKPAGNAENLPVAVYIHGGSLQTGQPWYADYSGEGFAKKGVITVNMGYRLGVFGFLGDEELAAESENGTTGNYGLLDQIKALEWVRDNIAAFGGDPENVTLIGESAGAVCVDALCVSPLAEGLFKRAVMESSTVSAQNPPHSWRLYDEALESGRKFRERYQCSSLEQMRALSAETIAEALDDNHHITVDGYVLPDTPYHLRSQGVHNEEALLHGYNAEESGPFILFSKAKLSNYEEKIRHYFGEHTDEVLSLYPAGSDEEADQNWAKIYGALFFNYSHYCLNRLENENSVPVYEYLFSKDNGRLGCWHSGELVYTFHVIPEDSTLYSEADRTLSDEMNDCWVSFMKTSDPGFAPSDSTMIMQFGLDSGMIDEPFLKLYEIIDQIQESQ